MNFGNDMYLYDIERIADLKSMAEYGKRTIKRLQDELKEAQQVIEKQMSIIDNINNLFATTKASTYCTNEQSIIYQTLSKEISPQKADNQPQEIHEPIGNLYNYPQTTEIISALKNEINFQDFFYDFPLAFVALFDQSPIQFNTDEIILEVETWPTERRINFFTAFFEHLNSAAFFLSSLLSIVDCESIPILSEYLETGLSSILNCSRVAFFIFDNEENELIMEKHQLQMRMQINDGIIYESLIKNKLSLVSQGFEKISKDDLSLLKKNQVILSIPIYCNSVPTALLLLYDKIGGFKQYDYIIGQTLSNFISQAIPIISMRQDRKKVSKMLHESLDSFLQLVSANDIKSFLKIIPDTFSQHFQCEHARIFKISDDEQFFSELVDNEKTKKSENFPIQTGIIGQSISQLEPIRITRPEFSQSFYPDVDRSNPSVLTHSILVCPMLTEKSRIKSKIDQKPRFVVSLYNKKNLDSFSDIDVEKLKMICEHLNNILTSLLEESNLTVNIENSEHTVSLYNSLFKMFVELSTKKTFDESLKSMAAIIKSTMDENSTIDLFYINKPYKSISSFTDNYNARLLPSDTNDDQDPISFIASKSQTKELQKDDKIEIFCGLKNNSNDPVGLIKITKKESNLNVNSKKSDSLSAFRSSSSLLSDKNIDQKAKFKDLNDKQLSKLVSFWEKLVGPIIDEMINKENITKLIKICDNLIEKLPSDPRLAVTIFNELQFMMNSNDKIDIENKNEKLNMFVFNKNDDYYRKTRDLIVSFSLLLASSQKEENAKSDSLIKENKSIGFVPDQKYNIILNDPKFDVFFYQEDFLNGVIMTSFSNLGVLKFLSIDFDDAISLINELKELHKSNGFKTWELSVDHFQFATFLIKSLGKSNLISIEQTTALLFYLLSLYCVPYLKDPEMTLDKPRPNSVYSPSELITKFYIENGNGFSPLSSFIAAVCGMNNQSAIKIESIDIIAPFLKKLDCTQKFDFLNSRELYLYIACISQYSYLARPVEIAKKWIDKRLKEEILDDDEINDDDDDDDKTIDSSFGEEILKSQIDFDLKSILIPTFGEFTKRDIKIDHIRKLFTATVSKITGNSL